VKRKKDAKSRLFTGILRLFLLLSCQTRDYITIDTKNQLTIQKTGSVFRKRKPSL